MRTPRLLCSRVISGWVSIILWLLASFSGLIHSQNSASGDPAHDLLTRAQQLIVDNQIGQAQEILISGSRQFPNDPRIFNFLGVVHAQKGEYTQAEGSFSKAIELAPGYVGAYLNLGRLYQENLPQDPEAAKKGIEAYQKLLKLQPGNLEAIYQIALLLHLESDYQKSLGYLLQLPKEQAERPQAMALKCANYAALGQNNPADTSARSLIAQNKFIEEDLLVVLPVFLSSGRADLAIDLLENLRWRDQLSIPSAEGLAILYADNNRLQDGINLLESLAGRHPDFPSLLMKLAWICFDHSDYEGSLRYLAHARDLRPDDPRIHILFGLACVELDLGMEAIKSLEQAVAVEPENPYYHYALGSAVLAWKEAKEAVPYFERFHQMRPDDPRGIAALAQAHFLNKQYDLAKEEFEVSIRFPETEFTSNYYLGVIARIELRLEDAEAYFSKVLQQDPEHADTLAEMGWIYTRRRDFENAGEVLDRAIEIDPENYHANFNLMTLYSRTRDERFEEQKARFDQIKEKRWQHLTDSLRSIEVIPHFVFPGRQGRDIFSE